MNNSKKVKQKIILNKVVSLISLILSLYLIYKYLILKLIPLFDKWIAIGIYSFFLISILIIWICYINKLNIISRNQDVFYDLDNNLDKVFEKYGLYITKKHIVCIGSKFNFFKTFVVELNNIDAIDIHHDSRYLYRKKGSKWSLFSFIKGAIKTDIMYGDNDRLVFNIICGKKIYCITTSSILNRKKSKEIKQMGGYICNKHKSIDYI